METWVLRKLGFHKFMPTAEICCTFFYSESNTQDKFYLNNIDRMGSGESFFIKCAHASLLRECVTLNIIEILFRFCQFR